MNQNNDFRRGIRLEGIWCQKSQNDFARMIQNPGRNGHVAKAFTPPRSRLEVAVLLPFGVVVRGAALFAFFAKGAGFELSFFLILLSYFGSRSGGHNPFSPY